jgi:transcription elongation factor GreA
MWQVKNPLLTTNGMNKLKEERSSLASRYKDVNTQLKAEIESGEVDDINVTNIRIELANLQTRMNEIDDILRRARPINRSRRSSKVSLGKTIFLRCGFSQSQEVTLVDSIEADPFRGSVSVSSPLGNALLGKKVNEIAEVKTPRGSYQYQIMQIK